VNKLEYKYNQYIFRKAKNRKRMLSRFIAYRPDKDTIVYEFEDAVHQCPSIEIYPADYIEIKRYFATKIARQKRQLTYEKNSYKQDKISRLNMMNNIQQKNKRIKEIAVELFSNRLVEKVTNTDICAEDIGKLLNERTELKRDIKEIKYEYNRKHETKTFNLNQIKKINKLISLLKNELNEILKSESEYYIKDINKYKKQQIEEILTIWRNINENR
jgi:HD superfamily phosphohydrolase YqeK